MGTMVYGRAAAAVDNTVITAMLWLSRFAMSYCCCTVRRARGHSAHDHLRSIKPRLRTTNNSRRHFIPPRCTAKQSNTIKEYSVITLSLYYH